MMKSIVENTITAIMKSMATFVFLAFLLLGSCEPASPDSPASKCSEATEFVQEVEEREGMIYRMADSESYAISYHYEGTYDAVDVGIICHIASDFALPEDEEETFEVIFSGVYWKYTDVPPSAPAGSTTYYLEVTDIRRK